MNQFLKANLIALYLLAIASLAVELPWGSGPVLQRLVLIVLAIHAVELVFAFKHVKAYRGPLATSVLLTMAFGLMHWLPIAKTSAQAEKAAPRADKAN